LCYPPLFFVAAGLLVVLAGAGLIASVRRWRLASSSDAGTARLWALHLVLIVTLGTSAVAYALIYHNTWQGRLWMPAFPSLAMLLAAGLLAHAPTRRQPALAIGVMVMSLAAGVYGLFGLLLPAYGLPRAPLPFEVSTARPLDAQIGASAQVLAYRLGRTRVTGGETLAVKVFWRVLAPTARPQTVFIHLFSPEYGSLAQRDTYPGLGNYPTIYWDPGRAFVDTYRLYLPADLPATQAMILLGLYDETTGERLSVTGANAGPVEERWVEFGTVSVR
jgi:hypothetical protein